MRIKLNTYYDFPHRGKHTILKLQVKQLTEIYKYRGKPFKLENMMNIIGNPGRILD